MWISTDPAIGKYLPTADQLFYPEDKFDFRSMPGIGGVYNSVNLNVYHYAGQNPIKLVDPDGNQIYLPKGASKYEQMVADWINGSMGLSDGSYTSEASGLNNRRAFATGMMVGFINEQLPLPLANLLPISENDKKHKQSFNSGKDFGSKAGKTYGLALIARNVVKFTGKKVTQEYLKSTFKEIMRDPKRKRSLAGGIMKAMNPDPRPTDFDNFDEALGYAIGKMGWEVVPASYKEDLVKMFE